MLNDTETDFNAWDDDDPHASALITPRASKKPKTKRYGVSWTEDEVRAIEKLQKHLMSLGYVPPRGRSETVAAAVKTVAHALTIQRMYKEGSYTPDDNIHEHIVFIFNAMFEGLELSKDEEV